MRFDAAWKKGMSGKIIRRSDWPEGIWGTYLATSTGEGPGLYLFSEQVQPLISAKYNVTGADLTSEWEVGR